MSGCGTRTPQQVTGESLPGELHHRYEKARWGSTSVFRPDLDLVPLLSATARELVPILEVQGGVRSLPRSPS